MSSSYEYKKKFYDDRREKAKTLLGGNCVVCGTTENLHFDHIDSATKQFDISQGLFHSSKVFWAEVVKCQLLCQPHHLEKTLANKEFGGGLNKLERVCGTAVAYGDGCRCDDCKKWKKLYRNGLVDSIGMPL